MCTQVEVNLDLLVPEMRRVLPVIENVFAINGQTPRIVQAPFISRDSKLDDEAGLVINLKSPSRRRDVIKLGLECRLGSQYKVKYHVACLRITYIGTINLRSNKCQQKIKTKIK